MSALVGLPLAQHDRRGHLFAELRVRQREGHHLRDRRMADSTPSTSSGRPSRRRG
jgi:hypothetical protein